MIFLVLALITINLILLDIFIYKFLEKLKNSLEMCDLEIEDFDQDFWSGE